ncbi:MAG: cyclase [Planctomycetota bacterium]|nr:MAG: cyclase [Planctomycetota bacterium]
MILRDAARHRAGGTLANPLRRRYVKEIRIDASPEVVFRFHESPEALRSLIPPWEKMEVAESSGSLQPGSKVVLRGRVAVFPVRWVAVHTEYDPPHLFADRQESGPFAFWYHRHRFIDDGRGGTILRDEVEYQAPLGWIGALLGGWLIRRKLERMFAFRHQTTQRLIESCSKQKPWSSQPSPSP